MHKAVATPTRRAARRLAPVVALAVGLGACSATGTDDGPGEAAPSPADPSVTVAPEADLGPFYEQQLQWGSCQDVDPPELRHRGVDQGLAVLRVRDVGGDGERPPAGRLDGLLGVDQPVGPARAERHVRTGLGEGAGEDGAEP